LKGGGEGGGADGAREGGGQALFEEIWLHLQSQLTLHQQCTLGG
jgi:hypothetical protein